MASPPPPAPAPLLLLPSLPDDALLLALRHLPPACSARAAAACRALRRLVNHTDKADGFLWRHHVTAAFPQAAHLDDVERADRGDALAAVGLKRRKEPPHAPIGNAASWRLCYAHLAHALRSVRDAVNKREPDWGTREYRPYDARRKLARELVRNTSLDILIACDVVDRRHASCIVHEHALAIIKGLDDANVSWQTPGVCLAIAIYSGDACTETFDAARMRRAVEVLDAAVGALKARLAASASSARTDQLAELSEVVLGPAGREARHGAEWRRRVRRMVARGGGGEHDDDDDDEHDDDGEPSPHQHSSSPSPPHQHEEEEEGEEPSLAFWRTRVHDYIASGSGDPPHRWDPASLTLALEGNQQNYYSTPNSDVALALATGAAIPLTLTLLWCAVGVACGLPCEPVGAPGHVLASCALDDGDGGEVFVDTFRPGGVVMDLEEATLLLPQVPNLPGGRYGWREFGRVRPKALACRVARNVENASQRAVAMRQHALRLQGRDLEAWLMSEEGMEHMLCIANARMLLHALRDDGDPVDVPYQAIRMVEALEAMQVDEQRQAQRREEARRSMYT